MPDIVNSQGIQTKTLPEIIADLTAGFKAIYGADINVDQNSPDGQVINIFGQASIDIRELATQIYNSFNPDRAVGRSLDERVVINNIERKGGTYTIVPITMVIDRTIDLAGLDGQFNNPNGVGYTVQDNQGNKFILVDSETFTAGTYSRNFRANLIGQVETTLNTITTAVTIVLGVVSVDNPSGPLEIGENEETDAELRVRRQQSVALGSQGYLNGLLGAVLNLDGVTDAKVYENYTNAVDADGIPAHGTWLIVEGGANTDIGNTYYAKKSYGSNMKGAVEVDILTPSGATFTAKFDRPTAADLYIRFDIQPYDPSNVFDLTAIKQYMADALSYRIGQFAETASLTAIALASVIANGGGGAPVNMEISDDGITYVDYLTTPTKQDQWTVDPANIAITVL